MFQKIKLNILTIMTTIEIKGIGHEAKAQEVLKMLTMLKEVGKLMKENTPTHSQASKDGILNYYETMFSAESKYSDLVCKLSEALGELVADDITNAILV